MSRSWVLRALAGVGAAACAVLAAVLLWASVGEVAAQAGAGPPDGVFTVSRCHDGENGTRCGGTFVPAGGGERRRPVELGSPRGQYGGGERLVVRLSGSTAYERSAMSVAFILAQTLLLGGLFGSTAVWLTASARRGRIAGLGLYPVILVVTILLMVPLFIVAAVLEWLVLGKAPPPA
ncbi:hypothetical protein ACFV0R_26725 [Streptomyces sp. NPDC059578]|uniref:hypothetical protein n=1 Tax=Streptomyces sp. NPDC059578 TaxID=3346874 RepID=UPI003673A57E